jgi:hypothetical protein
MMATKVTAQICNTAVVSAMSAVGATNMHANGQTSPRLPADNGTGYSPRHLLMHEASPATSTSGDVATTS